MPMFLKQIEVENFKSFNGKSTIGPFKDFTAVIGPNGSGKSNFMDAISFVAGEKTTKLRVKRLNDLIHGAAIGKPVSNTASVTAVFESSEGSEIKFKRSVQNSASEYRLNDVIITREDYIDELHRYGINAKAKNFLVFQGSVEEIATMRPQALTSLLEEISTSGTFKAEYDRSKAEKLQAEKATQFAFQKKKGIAADRKEAKLEKQEAQQFQRLRKEYVKKDVELQLFNLFTIEKKSQNLENQLEEKQEEIEVMEAEKEIQENSLKERKKEAGVANRTLAKHEQDFREAEVTISQKEPQFIKTKENVAYLQRKLETAKKSLEQARNADKALKKDIRELEAELSRVEEAKAAYEASLDEESQVGDSLSVTLEENQIKVYNRLKEEASKESARYQQSLDSTMREQKSDRDKLDNELRKKTEIDNKIKQKRHTKQDVESRLEKLDECIKTIEASLEDFKKQRDELQSVVGGSREKCQRIQREIEHIGAELGDATLNKNEVFRNRKKTEVVENLKGLFPGVYDRVINLSGPIHPRYNVAVTKVLGKNMDAIVVDTEKTGRECIQYLKANLIEPETFLPLDYIRPKQLKDRLRAIEEPPNVKLIYDVLKFYPRAVEPAILYVTRNTLVCETADDAARVAYDLVPNQRYDCVALDGTFFQKSGIICGGTLDLRRRAKRWDEKQMSQLKARKDDLTEELKDSLMQSRREFELNNVETQIKSLEARLHYCKADQVEATTNHALLQRELADLQIERENLEPAIAAIERSMAEREQEIHKIKESVNSLEDHIFDDFCNQIGVSNIRQYEQRGLQAQQERERRRMDFDNQYNRIASQLDFEKKRDTESNIARWERAVADAEVKLQSAKTAEIDLKAEIDRDEAKKKELEDIVKGQRIEVNRKEEEVSKCRSDLKAVSRDVSKVQRQINTIETTIEKLKGERHAILMKCKMEDITIPTLEGDLEDLGSEGDDADSTEMNYQREDQIKIDYELLPDELKEIDDESDIGKVIASYEKSMKELNSTIERIKAPNMRAEEKFSLVVEKFQETSGVFEQACRKVKKLNARFDKVKQQRYDHFMTAFEHIAKEIDTIYKDMMRNQSAQAYLITENTEEPYLGGITFTCVAPGKRFQTMANLSGGEKTVAGLALLFAINSLQPSPFFVLDEIDAALDNANVLKVANYIRNRSTSIQMIVVSLKLALYSKANTLIGIAPDLGECLKSEILTLDLGEYLP